MSESLTSISMNFSNGSGHTASTTSIRDAKDLSLDSNDSIGRIIGEIGERVDFTNRRLNDLFSRFIMTEKTISKDGVKTTVSRKFTDRTSLLLKSHFVAVRGKDIAPNGSFKYGKLVFDYAECPTAPVSIVERFGNQRPIKRGGALIVGNIYNEIQETNELTGQIFSLVYKNGSLVTEFCYQPEFAGSFYINNPDLSKSSLKFGYTLRELRSAINQIGVGVVGLPNRNDILFDNSGNLDSVLGAVASSLGMYWYVNPTNGTVNFVSSSSAAALDVTNPLLLSGENILDCSFTRSALSPVIPCSYMSEQKPLKQEDDEKERIARFKLVDILGELTDAKSLKIPKQTYGYFYAAYAAKQLNSIAFDSISFKAALDEAGAGGKRLDFGQPYPDFELSEPKAIEFAKDEGDAVYNSLELGQSFKNSYNGPFGDLFKGRYIQTSLKNGVQNKLPSSTQAFEIIQNAFSLLDNQIYVSNKYSRFKAQRMKFSSSAGNVSGPYKIDTKLKNVESLGSVYSFLRTLGVDRDITLEVFIDNTVKKQPQTIQSPAPLRSISQVASGRLAAKSNSVGEGDYVFIATTQSSDIPALDDEDLEQYLKFSDENVINYSAAFAKNYFGIEKDLLDAIPNLITKSKDLFNKRLDAEDGQLAKTLRCPFTRSKTPVNELLDDKPKAELETAIDDQDAEKDEDASKVTELFDKMTFVNSEMRLNGASGNPLSPVSFEVKKGTNQEVSALLSENFGGLVAGRRLVSSSRTLVGLHIPNFKVTLSGLSISLTSSGVTTTIQESTKSLIPVDDQIITTTGGRSVRTSSLGGRFSASQRNFLGL